MKVQTAVLDTIESFLDTCPDLEGQTITTHERIQGETPEVLMMKLEVDGESFLVVVKKGS